MVPELCDGVGVKLAEAALEGEVSDDALHVLENETLPAGLPVSEVIVGDEVLSDEMRPDFAATGLADQGTTLFPPGHQVCILKTSRLSIQ